MIKRNDGISKDDICQNQFTAYVVLAVKRKRQSYIKKKQREHEKKPELKRRQNNPNLEPPGMICGAEWSRKMKTDGCYAAIKSQREVCCHRVCPKRKAI